MGDCDGENGRELVRYEERLRGFSCSDMAMAICAGWFLDRKRVVSVYAIIIDDGESNFGLRFTILGFPRDRVYTKFTQHFVYYIHSFISELIMRMFLPQGLPFGFKSGIHAHNAPYNIPIAILSNPVAYDNAGTSISSQLLVWAI